jgi:hypothetical protein
MASIICPSATFMAEPVQKRGRIDPIPCGSSGIKRKKRRIEQNIKASVSAKYNAPILSCTYLTAFNCFLRRTKLLCSGTVPKAIDSKEVAKCWKILPASDRAYYEAESTATKKQYLQDVTMLNQFWKNLYEIGSINAEVLVLMTIVPRLVTEESARKSKDSTLQQNTAYNVFAAEEKNILRGFKHLTEGMKIKKHIARWFSLRWKTMTNEERELYAETSEWLGKQKRAESAGLDLRPSRESMKERLRSSWREHKNSIGCSFHTSIPLDPLTRTTEVAVDSDVPVIIPTCPTGTRESCTLGNTEIIPLSVYSATTHAPMSVGALALVTDANATASAIGSVPTLKSTPNKKKRKASTFSAAKLPKLPSKQRQPTLPHHVIPTRSISGTLPIAHTEYALATGTPIDWTQKNNEIPAVPLDDGHGPEFSSVPDHLMDLYFPDSLLMSRTSSQHTEEQPNKSLNKVFDSEFSETEDYIAHVLNFEDELPILLSRLSSLCSIPDI